MDVGKRIKRRLWRKIIYIEDIGVGEEKEQRERILKYEKTRGIIILNEKDKRKRNR